MLLVLFVVSASHTNEGGVGEKPERPERVYVLPHNIFPKTAWLDKASVIMIVAVQHLGDSYG